MQSNIPLATERADNSTLVDFHAVGVNKREASTALQVVQRNGGSNVPMDSVLACISSHY